MANTVYSLTQLGVEVESKIPQNDAKNLTLHSFQAEAHINDSLNRWQSALEDARCLKILVALHTARALSPKFALSARAIGKLTGLHHQVVRRLIRGDKRCRAKLMGLVAWQVGGRGQKTRYWLSHEGRKVVDLLAKGLEVGKATLTALATDRQRRNVAHQTKVAHQSGTPTENNTMLPYGSYNECSLTAVALSKPVRKPLTPLAERLYRDYGIRWWVAEDLVARYSPLAIEAAIALRERRNGAIVNGAGFIVYLLRDGYAQRLAEAWLRARQRPRKSSDEPDWDAKVATLREALEPYGISVDDEGFADLPTCRLALPPDPDEALDLLRRIGILRDGNGQDADKAPDDTTDQAPKDADTTDALWAADDAVDDEGFADPLTDLMDNTEPDADDGDDGDDDDDGEPLPPPSCDLCGRKEGEPHPALASWQRNDFLCLSELSDDFKQRFGLSEAGLLCRGCYVTLCRTLLLGGQPDLADATDQAPRRTPTRLPMTPQR